MGENKIIDKFNRALDLPVNLLTGNSLLYIIDDKEALIEGHKGILQYDEDIIKIAAKNISISFLGKNLSLRSLNNENIIIQGQLQNISFEKR